MNAPLDIGRLSTRIRSSEPERAQALAGQLRQVAGPGLTRALDGAGERALARAGLPAEAMVAVRRLDLALRVSAAVDERQLAEGWAAAFEAALAGLLARTPAGDDDDASVVWFADAWAAEGRHLQRRAAGLPDAWWAQDLADAGSHLAAADTPDGLEALTILLRWLARDPPRAVTTIAALARSDARIATAAAFHLAPGQALVADRDLPIGPGLLASGAVQRLRLARALAGRLSGAEVATLAEELHRRKAAVAHPDDVARACVDTGMAAHAACGEGLLVQCPRRALHGGRMRRGDVDDAAAQQRATPRVNHRLAPFSIAGGACLSSARALSFLDSVDPLPARGSTTLSSEGAEPPPRCPRGSRPSASCASAASSACRSGLPSA